MLTKISPDILMRLDTLACLGWLRETLHGEDRREARKQFEAYEGPGPSRPSPHQPGDHRSGQPLPGVRTLTPSPAEAPRTELPWEGRLPPTRAALSWDLECLSWLSAHPKETGVLISNTCRYHGLCGLGGQHWPHAERKVEGDK